MLNAKELKGYLEGLENSKTVVETGKRLYIWS